MRVLFYLMIMMGCLFDGCRESYDIVIGSKNFTEQVILGELLAEHIERNTRLTVDRRLNLGGTFICDQAMRAGEIDGYVEYTGTAFVAILKNESTRDARAVFQGVKESYLTDQLEWLEPFGFNNTFAVIIRAEDSRRLGITSISEVMAHTPEWTVGFGYEFMERADGFTGLVDTYGLRFKNTPRVMELGLTYRALFQKEVDLIAGNSTDGLIDALGLQVLEDDQHYFPPYDAVPVFRSETLTRHHELTSVIDALGGTISETAMRQMNYQVDAEGRMVREVVEEFLDRLSSLKTGS